ncbi:MAG: hypothetical protein ACTSPY_12310 [Candidatus Helarchaeota archaeon]
MTKVENLDPRLNKLIKVWLSITLLLAKKMNDHCLNCTKSSCKTCKLVKLKSLLEEIETIIEEDNFLTDYYKVFEQIGVIFRNSDDE